MQVLPEELYRPEQVRRLDRLAMERYGLPGEELMERAGRAVFEAARRRWPDARLWTVVAGPGNNGGDGLVVARLAHQARLRVKLHLVGDPSRLQGEALHHYRKLREAGLREEPERVPPAGQRVELAVDALFGTGLARAPEGEAARAVAWLNGCGAPVVAVDLPSGLDGDTGRALGEAVRAALTVSFVGLKRGLLTGQAPDHVGELRFDALGVPAEAYAQVPPAARRLHGALLPRWLPRRPRTAHKGRFGHVLVVGGAPGMVGAACLAGEAAARAGAGLVSLAVHPAQAAGLAARRPELMVHPVSGAGELEPLLARATVVAAGPGLGQGPWGRELLARVLEAGLPLVLDADALNLLAQEPQRRRDWVLTPHPGEAARLLGLEGPEAVQADRFAAVEALADRYGGTVVLKGAGSLVHEASAGTWVCGAGNPGMASGGMGDLLTGLVAGLLAQGLEPWPAAAAAVWVHARAGDLAAAEGGERGLLASDLLPRLRPLLNPPLEPEAPAPGDLGPEAPAEAFTP